MRSVFQKFADQCRLIADEIRWSTKRAFGTKTSRSSANLTVFEDRILYSAAPAPVQTAVHELPGQDDAILNPDSNENTSRLVASFAGELDSSETSTRELVFVDSSFEDYQELLEGIWDNTELNRDIRVILLSNQQDGIEQISSELERHRDLESIHLISRESNHLNQFGQFVVILGNYLGLRRSNCRLVQCVADRCGVVSLRM